MDGGPGHAICAKGAPEHWTLEVRKIFPGRWIERGSPIAWPPRSLDITPLDLLVPGVSHATPFIWNVVAHSTLYSCGADSGRLDTKCMIYGLYQGWRTSDTRTIDVMRHNILRHQQSKWFAFYFKITMFTMKYYEETRVIGRGVAKRNLICCCLALVTLWTTIAYDEKFV
ncbi:hypothetical protein TNCV_4807041 [Trichonephila clavipes]|nr:hypothetical protein TNCV_4807041 [Trichonephila clavipes]